RSAKICALSRSFFCWYASASKNSAVSLKSVSAKPVIRLSAAAMVWSGPACAAANIAFTASNSFCDFGAGGLACAIRLEAPAANARMPVRMIRFMRKLLRMSLLFRTLLHALFRLIARHLRRACHSQGALKMFAGLFAVARGQGKLAEVNQRPSL